MTNVLFAASDANWKIYQEALPKAFAEAGVEVNLVRKAEPRGVDYIIYAPNSEITDFSPFTNLKAILGLWAGVEAVVNNPTLTVPYARMVDVGMSDGMVEWCTAHVLRHHLGLDQDICRRDQEWVPHVPPLATDRAVTVLGLGALGQAVAQALAALKFRVTGWSRSQKDIKGITCLAGGDGLAKALRSAEIVVLLVPLTAVTKGLMNAERLAMLPKGAVVINPGRGPLIDDEALLAALESGHVSQATLDVFRTEPLPKDHAYWAHPNVTVTPHIASHTRPESASRVVAENIARAEAGAPLLHLIDTKAGY